MPSRGGAAASVFVPLGLLALLSRQHPPLWRYLLYLGQARFQPRSFPGLAASALAGFCVSLGAAGPQPRPACDRRGTSLMLFALAVSLGALDFATKSAGLANLGLSAGPDRVCHDRAAHLGARAILALARVALLQRRARDVVYRR